MCQVTTDATIKVAEQDITVYKGLLVPKVSWLKRLLKPKSALPISMATGWPYEKGVVQPTVTLKPHDWGNGRWAVEEGYHSFADRSQSEVNAEFIIPKGTNYILGIDNGNANAPSYVSETIIFKGLI